MLTANQHATARDIFEELSTEMFLPFDQINEDPVRANLDRRVIVDVLGLSQDLVVEGGPMETLRAKLAAEPQIHADKKTRVVFDAEEERSVRRR